MQGPTPRLIGREQELADLGRCIAEHRLVTVTGPGGVGKTSLVLAAISGKELSPERVVVCELADVESAGAVRHQLAAQLGRVLRPGERIEALLPTDGGSGLLVVLDNCEHLAEAAAEAAQQLLLAGPHVRVLATSREPLRLPAERVMALQPLAVPRASTDADAGAAPSVLLFTDRARRVDPTFTLDEASLPSVIAICRVLDGLPLALEIAAARVRILSVRDIAEQLARPLALLRSSEREAPERHSSLRAVIDWSFNLLEPQERALFTALGVHPSGCDLPAATAAALDVGIDSDEVLDVLDSLVAKSLMTARVEGTATRYRMLETLRDYGIQRLDEAGVLGLRRDRHADYYAGEARRLRDLLVRAWTRDATTLFVEIDNIRAALSWTLEHDVLPDRTFDLLAPLWYAALQRNAEEVSELAARALQRWPDPRNPRWSEVAGTAATALATVEDYEGARARGREAAGAGTSSGIGRAFGYCALAHVALHADDDPHGALLCLEQADDEARAAGFTPLRCDLRGRRAQVLAQVRRDTEALATAEEAYRMAREQGNDFELAWSQHLIGLLLIPTDPEAAEEWLGRALAGSRALQYPYGTSSSLRGLGIVALGLGDVTTAAERLAEALTGFSEAGHLGERWNTVAATVSLLAAAGRRESAAALLVGLESAGVVVSRIHAPLFADVRGRLTRELGSSRVQARAQAMSRDELLALAWSELRQLRGVEDVPDVPRQRTGQEGQGQLRRAGDLWQVTYAGTSAHLPDLRGIHDLAVLLARPGTEVAALDLVASVGVAAAGASAPGRYHGGHAPGDLGEQLDARARAEYAARVRELQTELDEAGGSGDAERGARLQQELDLLTHELSTAYGLHGPRRTGDPAERARSTVTARIRVTVARITEAHPELGRHLQASVRTGRFCSYRPERPTTWVVST